MDLHYFSKNNMRKYYELFNGIYDLYKRVYQRVLNRTFYKFLKIFTNYRYNRNG